MKSRNTMTEVKYVAEMVAYTIFAFILYRIYLYRCLPNIGDAETTRLLCVLVVAAEAAGVLISFRRYRTEVTVITNIVIPFGVFTILAYRDVSLKFIVTVMALGAVILLANGIVSFRKMPMVIRRRTDSVVPYMYHQLSVVVAVVMSVVMLGISWEAIF